MGEVFLARDLALGRAAAVKVLSSALTPEARARLFREAAACARLQHPAIATSRVNRGSLALYTSPIPPAPTGARIS